MISRENQIPDIKTWDAREEQIELIRNIWTAIWKIVVLVLLWGFLYAPLLIPVASRLDQFSGLNFLLARVFIEITGALLILLAAWIMVRFIDKRPFLSLGFAPANVMRDVSLGLAIGVGMIVVSVGVSWICGWANLEPMLSFSGASLILSGIAMLANTVTQEVLVRGYIQQTIQSQFGAVPGIILAAIIFTVLHAGAIQGALLPAINLFAVGVLLGIGYATTWNLWLPIALHFAWNFLEGPVLGLAVSGQAINSGGRIFSLNGPTIFTGGNFGLEGGLVATSTTLLGITVLIVLRRQIRFERAIHARNFEHIHRV